MHLPDFQRQANVLSQDLYEEAGRDREAFWARQAKCLDWFHPWEQTMSGEPPYAKWFVGGKLNACYNCVDRHAFSSNREKIAILWEGEFGEERSLSYEALYEQVCRFSNVLKNLGIRKGDKVAIYLPLMPEAVIAMLSCARIGAIHTVVFAGFSATALQDRILDAEAKLLITADGGFRRGKTVSLKATADEVLENTPSIRKTVVVKRTGLDVPFDSTKDVWWHEQMEEASLECPPEKMDAEDVLYILYTSGTTGKPKGIVHTTGGYLVGATKTFEWIFDIKPRDVYWCTADVGWVTGHTYVVYGPLANGTTAFLYEGAPDFPERNRFWKLIEKYRVTILYTAPTAIRTFMKWGEEWVSGSDLSSLRLLGSVGEPINPEAWMWYYKHVGKERCPVVDTWWQTETGIIMIAPLPGIMDLVPGSASRPLPGIEAAVLDEQGQPASEGLLALTAPWPSMLRGIYNDPERYVNTYWKKWNDTYYFTGDGAKIDKEGNYWLMGRVDDVINVAGHRLGTMEIESALVDHPSVAEAAVIAIPNEIKGQGVLAFVSLKEKSTFHDSLEIELKEHVVKLIGAFARPERIIYSYELPKTRSGKIMRRLLRDIAEGKVLGDMTSLADPSVLENIKSKYNENES